MQAALLRVKLNFLNEENETSRQLAALYLENVKNPFIILPTITTTPSENVWHLFTIRTSNHEKLKSYLFEQGIHTKYSTT